MTLLTHPTVDQLAALGLGGMARAFAELQDNPKAAELGHAEWLALLLDREATERSNRRLTARLRHARLRQRATIEDVDYRAPRGLDRSLESFFSSLKIERIDRKTYRSRDEARADVFDTSSASTIRGVGTRRSDTRAKWSSRGSPPQLRLLSTKPTAAQEQSEFVVVGFDLDDTIAGSRTWSPITCPVHAGEERSMRIERLATAWPSLP
jgi:hypothetical protein